MVIFIFFSQWADICKTYLQEAKWYYSGYTPTLQEYIQNAWISISAPVILVHAYFLVTKAITKEELDCLEEYPSIIRQSSIILRLADDLGTSSVRKPLDSYSLIFVMLCLCHPFFYVW